MDALLDLGNGLARVEALRAHTGAVHDGLAPIQLVGIINLLQALLCELVPAVNDPPAQTAPGEELTWSMANIWLAAIQTYLQDAACAQKHISDKHTKHS